MTSTKQMAEKFSRLFFLRAELEEKQDSTLLKEVDINLNKTLSELKASGYDVYNFIDSLRAEVELKKSMETIIVFSDGGVRKNHTETEPSVGAGAYVIYGDSRLLVKKNFWIGEEVTTPSGTTTAINPTLSEYKALYEAACYLSGIGVCAQRIIFVTDCATLVTHVNGGVPKHDAYRDFSEALFTLITGMAGELKHVKRGNNKLADSLVNEKFKLLERGQRHGNEESFSYPV
jgi:hypothetical protein